MVVVDQMDMVLLNIVGMVIKATPTLVTGEDEDQNIKI